MWSDGTQVSQKLWDGATSSWQAATSFGDDNAGVLINAHPTNGAVVASLYEDDTSSTDDIIESHLTNGSQLWSSPSEIWNGGVRRNMGVLRMTQDVQSFE